VLHLVRDPQRELIVVVASLFVVFIHSLTSRDAACVSSMNR
jgi:hypothetical protein